MLSGTTAGLAATTFWPPRDAMAGPWPEEGWQIGCYTRPWAKYDYRMAMDAVAEAGFRYLGLTGAKTKTGRVIAAGTSHEEAVRVGEEARKRGLQIPIAYGGRFPANKSVQAGIESLRKMIDNTQAAGAWSVQITSLGTEKTYPDYCKTVAECCDYAAERKVALVVKPHGAMVGTGPLLRRAVEKIGHPNFRVWYDPGNIFYYSDGKVDPVEDCKAVDGLVVGMCVKDYQHPKKVAVTPGDGQVDFPALMRRMAKGGFTHGPLIVETLKSGDLAQTLREAKRARQFLEQLVGRS